MSIAEQIYLGLVVAVFSLYWLVLLTAWLTVEVFGKKAAASPTPAETSTGILREAA